MDVAFRDYVDRLLRPQDAAALGSGELDPPGSDLVPDPVLTRFLSSAETLYFFGDNNLTEWQNLLDQYRAPPYFLPGRSAAYSFGIAGQWEGTGPDLLRATNRPLDSSVHNKRSKSSWIHQNHRLLSRTSGVLSNLLDQNHWSITDSRTGLEPLV